MPKSLKEALLERFADLQELGLAPTATPEDDDAPAVVVDMAPNASRDNGSRRGRPNRAAFSDDDEFRRDTDDDSRAKNRRRAERGNERPRTPERGRRPSERTTTDNIPLGDMPIIDDRAPLAARPGGAPRPFDRPGFGTRGPARPGFAGPRPPGPRPPGGPGGGPRPFTRREPSVTERLQQRAEERRIEEGQREQLRQVMAAVSGAEVDDEGYDKFLKDLAEETGALPPLNRVIEAISLANSLDPAAVGSQVRVLNRRARPRPQAPQA